MKAGCFVEYILGGEITIMCDDRDHRDFLKRLGATKQFFRQIWTLKYSSDEELAQLLSALRDHGYALVNAPSGWPPGAVFEDLRERGLVSGDYEEIVWRGPNDPMRRRVPIR